jgi:hypothetical protein
MLEQRTTELRQQIEATLRNYPDLMEDEFLRAGMLEGELPLAEVLTEIHRMISDAMILIEGTKPRLDALRARRDRFERRIEFGRELIVKILQSAELRRIELAEMTLTLRKGQPKVLGEPDATLLPDRLCKIKREPNYTKIREALEAGEQVSGCVLSNAEPALTIRVK